MTEQDYELLSQYLDGELAQPEARALRHRLLAEPALRASYEALKGANDRVTGALDTADAARVPPHIRAMLADADSESRPAKRAVWGAAVAATVVLASGLLLDSGADREVSLARLLEQQPSSSEQWSALGGGQSARLELSFLGVDGNWCREFLSRDDSGTQRGVACRENGIWQTKVTAAVDAIGDSTGYRTASASDADAVAQFIQQHASDIPLGAAREKALIENGWH